jgi:hypothetical protein
VKSNQPGKGRPTSAIIAVIAVAAALAAIVGCSRKASAPECPSLPIVPHLEVGLAPPLSQNGEVQIELEADGTRETCAITIEGISPARPVGDMVQGPMTRAATTCKNLEVSGISNEGHVAILSVRGTPAQVTVRVRRGGKLLGEGSFKPGYKPDECGFINPGVTLTLVP